MNHVHPGRFLDQALTADDSVRSTASWLGLRPDQVSVHLAKHGLARPRRKAAAAIEAARAEIDLGCEVGLIADELIAELRAALDFDARFPASSLSPDALTVLAAQAGLTASKSAISLALGPERAERLAHILASEQLSVVGLSGAGTATRAHVVCPGCAERGGCGHAPTIRSLEANAERSPRCMHKARPLRAEAARADGPAQLAKLEAQGYWRLAPGATYTGSHKLVRLRCPQGCIDSYVYKSALKGARCRHCADGKLSQRILFEVLKAMFGGEWFWEDRSRGYEIDCWCPAPQGSSTGPIAAAHDGPTHFGIDVYRKGTEMIRRTAEIDRARAADLAAAGIPFVRVRFDDLTSDLAPGAQRYIFERIEAAVESAGLIVPAYQRFDLRTVERRRIEEASCLAKQLGVELRTSAWPGKSGKLEWYCPRHRQHQSARAHNFMARKCCCKRAAEPTAPEQLKLL